MNKKITRLALKKLKSFKKNDANIIILDNWRGYRFIYDTPSVRRCNNKCSCCRLYQQLKNEVSGFFTTGLIKASAEDKKLFGRQNYLNCKTLKQYARCYVNYLTLKTATYPDLKRELRLIKNLKIIYSSRGETGRIEKDFKSKVLSAALKRADKKKKSAIKTAWQSLKVG